MNSNLSTNQHI